MGITEGFWGVPVEDSVGVSTRSSFLSMAQGAKF